MKYKVPKQNLSLINIEDNYIPETRPNIPRAFDGQEPLAYLRDIIKVEQRMAQWLTGCDLSGVPSAVEMLASSAGFVPLTEEGIIDNKYTDFSLSTYFNNVLMNPSCKGFNYSGRYVYIKESDINSGVLDIIIDNQQGASHLGTMDGEGDGNLYLSDKTFNNLELVTIGKRETSKINLGDWKTGDTVTGLKYTEGTDNYVIETLDYINFSSLSGTFFVIDVLSPKENPNDSDQYITVVSECISESKNNVILAGGNWNHAIQLDIIDFQQATETAYKAKIRITLNLNKLFYNENYANNVKPHRFKVQVSHHNYDSYVFNVDQSSEYVLKNIYTWDSGDYLYLSNHKLDINEIKFKYELTDIKWYNSSNIDQIYSGNIKINLSDINYLWDPAGLLDDDLITITTNLIEPKTIRYNKDNFINNSYLNIESPSEYQIILPIKPNFNTSKEDIEIKYSLKNLVSSAEKTIIIKSTELEKQINTIILSEKSTSLKEVFNDNTEIYNGEQFRILEDAIKNAHTIDYVKEQTFPNLKVNVNFNRMHELQVIPGIGLVFPEQYKHIKYNNDKSYCRCFYIENKFDNKNLGGTIVIEDNNEYGITYDVFIANETYNLVLFKNIEEYKTNMKRIGNKLFIQFKMNNLQLLKFKIIAKPSFTGIKSIELRNFDTFNTFDYTNDNDLITYKLNNSHNELYDNTEAMLDLAMEVNNKWVNYYSNEWNYKLNNIKFQLEKIKQSQKHFK